MLNLVDHIFTGNKYKLLLNKQTRFGFVYKQFYCCMVNSFQKQCKLQINGCKLLIELKCSNMQMSFRFDQFDNAKYQLPER